MSRRPDSFARLAVLAMLAAGPSGLTACFTEIGNPDEETGMTAAFRVDASAPPTGEDGAPDSVVITAFRLRFLGASYHDADSTARTLWAARAGEDLDFAAGDTLKYETLSVHEPARMTVRLGVPDASGGDRLIRGRFEGAGGMRAFRFALPDTADFSIRFDDEALGAWRTGRTYACDVLFRARQWLALPGLDTASAMPDGAGGTVVIFDADHNPDLHQALTLRFYHAFNGPRAYPKKGDGP